MANYKCDLSLSTFSIKILATSKYSLPFREDLWVALAPDSHSTLFWRVMARNDNFSRRVEGRELSWAANGHSPKIRFKYMENWMCLIKATACFPWSSQIWSVKFQDQTFLFFFQSMSALNKFFSSSNTAARKGKHIYVQKWNKVRSVDLFAGTEEERVHNWGEAFDDLLLSSLHKFLRHLLLSKSWKMDKQVSKHELEKNLVSENQSWMGHF